jgi:chemotaxis protein methyltransferase CheR
MALLLSPFQTLIKARTGLMLEDANSVDKLRVALIEGMSLEGVASPEAYLVRLTEQSSSFQALINRLTINETYFFREPEQISFLVDYLVPELRQTKGSRPIRLLSAGCSTGEEPYSLVMALIERFGESALADFCIVGADIDSQALAKARQAHYSEFSFRGVSLERRHRFFDRIGSHFELKSWVRQQVSFHELNLFSPTISPSLTDFDVIFFRNVSIYFDTPTRKIIQQHLSQLLTEQGVLMIGTAETLANDLGVLSLLERDGVFYFSKALRMTPPLNSMPSKSAPGASTPLLSEAALTPPLPLRPLDTHADRQQLIEWVAQKRYDQALPLIDLLLAEQPQDLQACLLKAFVLMNRKQWQAAESLLLAGLAMEDWCLDTLVLLGLLAKWQQRTDQAIDWFKKAVYAHSDRWLAHYYLADSYRHSQPSLALRAYRTALQLIDQHPEVTGLVWVPLDFSVAELRFLCEHHIHKLSAPEMGAT